MLTWQTLLAFLEWSNAYRFHWGCSETALPQLQPFDSCSSLKLKANICQRDCWKKTTVDRDHIKQLTALLEDMIYFSEQKRRRCLFICLLIPHPPPLCFNPILLWFFSLNIAQIFHFPSGNNPYSAVAHPAQTVSHCTDWNLHAGAAPV